MLAAITWECKWPALTRVDDSDLMDRHEFGDSGGVAKASHELGMGQKADGTGDRF